MFELMQLKFIETKNTVEMVKTLKPNEHACRFVYIVMYKTRLILKFSASSATGSVDECALLNP